MVGDDRGQAFTLEGIVGGIVVLTAVLFALEAVVLTPTTAGTVDQDVKAQLRVEADDALTVAAEDGQLRALALHWDNSSREFDRSRGYGTEVACTTGPPGEETVCDDLGELLEDAIESRGYTYNLYVDYRNASAPRRTETERVVYHGVPSDNAVTATHTVVLYDDMQLTSPENASGETLGNISADSDSHFYASDADPDGPVFNVVEVRLVVW